MKGYDLIHKLLLSNYNHFERGIQHDLRELIAKRETVHKKNRDYLEAKIARHENYLKELREQELLLRELFSYVKR